MGDIRYYKMIWMRKYRKRKRREQLAARGKCPICTALLDSPYHSDPELALRTFGKICPYKGTTATPDIHEKVEVLTIFISN